MPSMFGRTTPKDDLGVVRFPIVSSVALSLEDKTMPLPPASLPSVPEQYTLPFYKQAAFYITMLLMPLVYIVVIMVLYPANGFDSTMKTVVVTAIMTTLLATGIVGFWLSSTYSNGKKDDQIAAIAAMPASTTINNSAPAVVNSAGNTGTNTPGAKP